MRDGRLYNRLKYRGGGPKLSKRPPRQPSAPRYNRAMSQPKRVNPFYSALVIVGVLFSLTACAYGVMTVRGLEPSNADEGGLIGFLDQYGLWILMGELAVLGLLTVAAIGTDEYWTRRHPIADASEEAPNRNHSD